MKKKKTSKKKPVPNWHRIISLSVAGQYIQNQLNEELTAIKIVK